MKRVALALSLLLVAACDLSVSTASIEFDAGLTLPDGGSVECGQNPCLNDGECALTNDGFKCSCPPGYEGDLCETDVDDCDPNPCLNDGVCTDGVASYTCECAAGFEGVDCSTNIDDCVDNPCQNDGVCTDMVNGYSCDCVAGYSGSQCEVDVDDCTPNPCENDGACVDGVNSFSCACSDGHSGVTCSDTVEKCTDSTCQNGGTCQDGPDGYTCICPAGYNGATCETDIDDCAPIPCANGATCTDKLNGFTCDCPDGTTGDKCQNLTDPCDPNPCLHDGTCMSASSDSYVCSCATGYKGATCEIDVDDCNPDNPCKNGGTCTDAVADFSCDCPDGWDGKTCNNDPDDCPDPDPCGEHGSCKDAVGGYTCACDPGFNGPICENDVDDCDPNPCKNDGTCTDKPNGFECKCKDGYSGSDCAIDVNDCAPNPCQNGGTCSDKVAGYMCSCKQGWDGTDCSVNIDDCTSTSCQNGGDCHDGLNTFTCTCPRFFSGDNCEITECSMIGVCSGNGMCDGQGGCACSTGYTGDDCELDIDECMTAMPPCKNGAGCTNNKGSYSCACVTGYTGMNCDACDTGYQDDDGDDVCCLVGYEGTTCLDCQAGYEPVGGFCQKTCMSTGLQCGDHGTCKDNAGDPFCDCDMTWFGPKCDSLHGTCSQSTCEPNGACEGTSDDSYKCNCDTAYVGRSCETLDYCMQAESMQLTPCSGNGMCLSGNSAYTCMCNAGWLGAECNEPDDCYAASQNGADACNHNGHCVDGNNTYTCMCDMNWLGAHCDNADDCVGNTCMNGSKCVDGNSMYTCDCTNTDHTGQFCETKIDHCMPDPCQNGGKCTDGVGTYSCDCSKTGYSGTSCELDADECTDNPSICSDGDCTNVAAGGGYSCKCPAGTLELDSTGTSCSEVASLAAGAVNTCAITKAGSLHCWGDNSYGQLNTGNKQNPASGQARIPKRIGTLTGWQKVSVGGQVGTPGNGHICAIRGGHLFCWGNNGRDQLGQPGDSSSSLIEVRSDLTWTDVSAGDTHTCALAGTALYCWGNSADGQAGTANSGTLVDSPKQIAGTWASVSAGANHTCAIDSTNILRCWGKNDNGQLGAAQPVPMPMDADGQWTAVKAGPTHTCALAGTKNYCWGTNTAGELGDGTTMDSTAAIEVMSANALGSLAAGVDFSCGVVADAMPATTFQVYCWGSNANGLLLGASSSTGLPRQQVRGSASAWSVYAVGKTHMCGVDAGFLYCWGSNADGALGSGVPDAVATHAPAAIATTSVVHSSSNNCSPNPCQNNGMCTATATGFTCSCAGGFSGTTCADTANECTDPSLCGQGKCYDLDSNPGYSCKCDDGMIDVDGSGKVCTTASTIALGYNQSCVLSAANTIHCWGSNRNGQLGLGMVGTTPYYPNESTQTVRTPLRLKDISSSLTDVKDWNKITVGEKHVCATRPAGGAEELYCWGDNTNGQVGIAVQLTGMPPAQSVPSPALLDNTQTWIALGGGLGHTCAINAQNVMYCWGYNNRGQTGNGTASATVPAPFSLSTPVPPPSPETGWASVAGGQSHTCATALSGTTYCWGGGTYGQIGNGATPATMTTITKVTAPADPQGYTSIAAGYSQSCGLIGTQAYCWGKGNLGTIGNGGTTLNNPTPAAVSGGLSFSRLTLANDVSCGLVPTTSIIPMGQAFEAYCWGSNTRSIQYNTTGNTNTPTRVGPTRTWRAFKLGVTHACAVDDADGLLYCWGDNGSEGSPATGIGKLGTEPSSVIANFPPEKVKAAPVTYSVP